MFKGDTSKINEKHLEKSPKAIERSSLYQEHDMRAKSSKCHRLKEKNFPDSHEDMDSWIQEATEISLHSREISQSFDRS